MTPSKSWRDAMENMADGVVSTALGTALVVLAALSLFWALTSAGEFLARPPGLSAFPAIELIGLDVEEEVVRSGQSIVARYEDPYEYVSRDQDWSVIAGRYAAQFTRRAPGDYALFVTSRTDVIDVRLNGVEIVPDVRYARLNGSFVAEPAVYTFPISLMNSGENQYTVTVRRNLRGPFIFPDFVVGPSAGIEPPAQFRHLMSVEIALVGIVVMLFTALLALSVAWPQADRARNIAFVAMLTAAALVAIMFMFSGAEKYEVSWLVTSSMLTAFQAICVLVYVFHDFDGGRMARWRIIGVVSLGLVAVALLVAITNYRGINPHYHLFILMITCRLFSVAVCALAAVLLALEIVRSQGKRFAERFILIIWFVATGLDQGHPGLFAVFSPFVSGLPLSLQWTPILGSLTGLAKVASLARQAGEARREVTRSNAILASRLTEQDAELARNYAAQRELMERQAVLEERQRIVRDMHDGIGGQLLALLMQVRGQDAVPERLADGLQASIADLRLIVDSMDTAEGGLADALHAFEHRARTLVEAAGMTFAMEHGLGEIDARFGPRETLSILRVVQEAVTNAVRHSGGTMVIVASAQADGNISIAVRDNGRGMTGNEERGRGLVNIEARALTLGGTASIKGGEGGTSVRLTLPIPTAVTAEV